MKKLLLFAFVLVAAYLVWNYLASDTATDGAVSNTESAPAFDYSQWRSGQQVEGHGRVIRIMSDDNDGSRHQRFIVKLGTGQTLLIAHNIDLAPRISSLRKGDTVAFNGEYEWNAQGGVVHWTHRDPQRRHVSGWIKHNGQVYQ